MHVKAGFDLTLVNPAGGPSPIDRGSMGEGFFTDACKKFLHDQEAMSAFCHQKYLSDVDVSGFDAIYMTGGHGCCTDFVENGALKKAIESLYSAGKVVAADCHGPICFAQCSKTDGTPLVAGLNVTGFSDVEEGQVQQTGNVPFLIEAKFKEQGGKFSAIATRAECVSP